MAEWTSPPDVIEDEVRRSLVAWIDRNTDWDVHDDERDATEDITRAMAQAICIDLAAGGWRLMADPCRRCDGRDSQECARCDGSGQEPVTTKSPEDFVNNVPGEHT